MFVAISKGKARRVEINGQDVSWRSLYRRSEDLVTAVVWSRLAYLSPRSLQVVLSRLFPDIGPLCHELKSIELWPYWGIEPDVVLHFESLTLVVEAKRVNEDNWQSSTQWRGELEAAKERYPDKQLALFAIGGLGQRPVQEVFRLKQELPETLQSIPVQGMSWQQFYQVIVAFTDAAHAGEAILIRDVCDAMTANGVTPYRDMSGFVDWLANSAEQGFKLSSGGEIKEFGRWTK
ncbi:hypothetical protein [Shewanella algae]|uniref:hypothetical protein n=1 Tax=Shewanella algae TaxID=38313 RepID=UPI0030065D0F